MTEHEHRCEAMEQASLSWVKHTWWRVVHGPYGGWVLMQGIPNHTRTMIIDSCPFCGEPLGEEGDM